MSSACPSLSVRYLSYPESPAWRFLGELRFDWGDEEDNPDGEPPGPDNSVPRPPLSDLRPSFLAASELG